MIDYGKVISSHIDVECKREHIMAFTVGDIYIDYDDHMVISWKCELCPEGDNLSKVIF